MSHFVPKTLSFARCCSVRYLTQSRNVSTVRWFSVTSECDEQQSYTASYLMNSLGFTQKSALLVSKSVKFSDPDKPDKAIEFLRNFGFTSYQITRLLWSFPKILVIDTEKVILPKLEFFLSKGISRPDLLGGLSRHPNVLKHSLAGSLMPSYECVKTFFGSEDTTLEIVKRNPHILVYKIEECFKPNVVTLQEHGFSLLKLTSLMRYRLPRVLNKYPIQFQAGVEAAFQTGFDPSNSNFLEAVTAILQCNWKSKINMYKKLGLSEKEILGAFLKRPRFLTLSINEITTLMALVNSETGSQPSDLGKFSVVLSYNLKKRVVPRVLFYRALLSRGIVNKHVSLSALLTPPENKFLEKFVTPYVEKSPELLKLHEETFGLSSVPENGKVSDKSRED